MRLAVDLLGERRVPRPHFREVATEHDKKARRRDRRHRRGPPPRSEQRQLAKEIAPAKDGDLLTVYDDG